MDDPVTSPITTEGHKTTFHSVKDKTRCHFQLKTYVQVQKDTTQKSPDLYRTSQYRGIAHRPQQHAKYRTIQYSADGPAVMKCAHPVQKKEPHD